MQAISTSGYVIPADIDPASLPTAGVIAWWRLKDTVDIDALQAKWIAAGLSAERLPVPPTPEQGIRRALKELEGKRLMVRPLVAKGTYAVVSESVVADGGSGALEHHTLFRAKVDLAGRITFDPDLSNLHVSQASTEKWRVAMMQEEIRTAYTSFVSSLSSGDVSNWLVRLAYEVQAVSLRDTGGIYFVPATALDEWRTITGVLRAVSQHSLYEVPALKSAEAVEAILAAISLEANEEIAKLELALEESSLGARGLKTRAARAAGMEAKLRAYETLLGRGAAAIVTRLEELQVQLATAALTAMDEANE